MTIINDLGHSRPEPGPTFGARPGSSARPKFGGQFGARKPIRFNLRKRQGKGPGHQGPKEDGLATRPNWAGERARSHCGTSKRSEQPSRQRRRNLRVGTWNVTSLFGKEQELIEEAIAYRLDIVGLSSTKRKGSGILVMDQGWQLFYSGVEPTAFA